MDKNNEIDNKSSRLCVCMYVRTYVRRYVGTYGCMHACMYVYMIPLAIWGGGAGTPDSVEGPNVRHPVSTLLNQSLLSRVGSYLLQNQEPSTAKISDKENSCFLQNQEPHMCKHQNKSKNITCWVKTSKDDSVEICVRVDSVEMFCWSLIL